MKPLRMAQQLRLAAQVVQEQLQLSSSVHGSWVNSDLDSKQLGWRTGKEKGKWKG